ncbi:hypothetical protein CBB_0703 [Clostridium botulinum Bf]|nr:hypothetical protein CBB_0703 [Clostridium botulinum Bf]
MTTYYYRKHNIPKIDLARVKTVEDVRYFLTIATMTYII